LFYYLLLELAIAWRNFKKHHKLHIQHEKKEEIKITKQKTPLKTHNWLASFANFKLGNYILVDRTN